MPVAYSRISSTFGARKHPVLGTMRMHKGVDYAAASGTPIMAAGDARVVFVGTQRGYGNVVIPTTAGTSARCTDTCRASARSRPASASTRAR